MNKTFLKVSKIFLEIKEEFPTKQKDQIDT